MAELGPGTDRTGGRGDGDPLAARLRTVVLIRWLAIAGQSITVAVVATIHGRLTLAPVLAPVLATIGASVLLNAWLSWHRHGHGRLGQRQTAWHMAFDVAQLATLIALTGGLQNPFCLFIMGPVALAAATLPRRHAALITGLAMAGMGAVSVWHAPLPWPVELDLPPLYRLATGVAVLLATAFIAFFTWSMANETRRMDAAYQASRTALLEEQKMAAVGGLAAMVAHELNTPLATVCLVARELRGQVPETDPLHPDLKLLVEQAERCRDILARLARRPERDAMLKDETVAISTLVEMAARAHQRRDIDILFATEPPPGPASQREPCAPRSAEILHGLGNLLDNAGQFAETRVEVTTAWTADRVTVRIEDDGPGFPAHLLERLGEPYLSTRDQDGSHLGLGIFIAKTLLSHTGARLAFANRPEGGAAITVTWRLADLMAPTTGEVVHA